MRCKNAFVIFDTVKCDAKMSFCKASHFVTQNVANTLLHSQHKKIIKGNI